MCCGVAGIKDGTTEEEAQEKAPRGGSFVPPPSASPATSSQTFSSFYQPSKFLQAPLQKIPDYHSPFQIIIPLLDHRHPERFLDPGCTQPRRQLRRLLREPIYRRLPTRQLSSKCFPLLPRRPQLRRQFMPPASPHPFSRPRALHPCRHRPPSAPPRTPCFWIATVSWFGFLVFLNRVLFGSERDCCKHTLVTLPVRAYSQVRFGL